MFEVNLNDTTLLIIVLGSFIGAIKGTFSYTEEQTSCNRLINVLVSILSGVFITKHYANDLSVWFAGLVALTSSMLSISVFDTLHSLVPKIVKAILKLRIKYDV